MSHLKVIILSAGNSRRMFPLTSSIPKPLLKLPNNTTLLENQLDVMSNFNIDEIIFVIGYLAEKIEKKIKVYSKKHRNGINIKTIFNPFHELSDNLVSLWMTKYEMDEDLIVLNGDDYITDIVMKRLLQSKSKICMVIDRKESYAFDDMKVITKESKVIKVGKFLDPNVADGESIGMVKFEGTGPRKLAQALDEIIRPKEAMKLYWLEAIQRLIDTKNEVNYVEVPADSWAEIDVHYDYEHLKKLIKQKLKAIV